MNASVIKVLLTTMLIKITTCTISGITYMDQLSLRPLPDKNMDPCNPLYWYPRAIPEHCYIRPTPSPPRPAGPPPGAIPLPVPVPIPQPLPFAPPGPPMPIPPSPMPLMPPLPPIMPSVPPQIPFGLPLIPSSPMLPMSGMPYSLPLPYGPPTSSYTNYPYRHERIGMVPGISGLVSDDGGINILPFSDVYSDMLEKHKNKLLRKKMEKLLRDYENYPRLKKRRSHRNNMYY